jgi:hypothetical protein
MNPPDTSARPMGLSHPGVLDAFAHDKRRDLLVLAMYESRPWNGDERQLHQLQEKLNAYASFILDGEMADSFPQFAGKPVEIQLRTRHQPDPLALGLLQQAREQLSLQKIFLETIQIEPEFEIQHEPPSGGGCGCGNGGYCAG